MTPKERVEQQKKEVEWAVDSLEQALRQQWDSEAVVRERRYKLAQAIAAVDGQEGVEK